MPSSTTIKAAIAKLGENIQLRRFVRYALDGKPGRVETYTHAGGRVAVMLELGAGIGNNGAMGGANVGGGMNGRFGGQADTGMSAQGRASTNGPAASDRDFGRDRAEDRTNANSRIDGNASTTGNARSELGGLNADHASPTARANAASGSRVGEIGTYETQMKSALAISDPTQRNAAITKARQTLAQTTNKPLTSGAIAQLDSDLHIQGASPQLGASR